MSKKPDAIIGTGVIGAATAFELAKLGYKTMSLDRNRQAGQGSTAASCAIIPHEMPSLAAKHQRSVLSPNKIPYMLTIRPAQHSPN